MKKQWKTPTLEVLDVKNTFGKGKKPGKPGKPDKPNKPNKPNKPVYS